MNVRILLNNTIDVTNTFKKEEYIIVSSSQLSSAECKNLTAAIAYGQDYDFKVISDIISKTFVYRVTVSRDSSD